jgi:hypothetical protein
MGECAEIASDDIIKCEQKRSWCVASLEEMRDTFVVTGKDKPVGSI